MLRTPDGRVAVEVGRCKAETVKREEDRRVRVIGRPIVPVALNAC